MSSLERYFADFELPLGSARDLLLNDCLQGKTNLGFNLLVGDYGRTISRVSPCCRETIFFWNLAPQEEKPYRAICLKCREPLKNWKEMTSEERIGQLSGRAPREELEEYLDQWVSALIIDPLEGTLIAQELTERVEKICEALGEIYSLRGGRGAPGPAATTAPLISYLSQLSGAFSIR